MKSSVVVVGALCLAGALVLLISAGVDGSSQQEASVKVTEPASLANFYPPKSHAPTYLLSMLRLSQPLSSMVCDLLENDVENARLNFETFKKAYIENSEMVPEWKSMYPLEPVEQLGAAITSGDMSKIMPATDAVGAVCHTCHVTNMVPVQLKYRWENFGDIVMTDPLSEQDVSYARLMLMLETNFQGIGNNAAQGQNENALRQLAGFNARFQAMSESCMICHDSERHYYVSKDITDKISALEAELSKPQIDMGAVGGLLKFIGNESCAKCHLVHIPAAYGQQLAKMH